MESCTGGLLSHLITDVPGCGDFFRGGFVAYATDVKETLGIAPDLLAAHGVVSEETAVAMAEQARGALGAGLGLGITGVAGPDPQDGVPVGIVYVALAGGGTLRSCCTRRDFGAAGLSAIKHDAALEAIAVLESALKATANEDIRTASLRA
jgi:PncC family amidohydrolase